MSLFRILAVFAMLAAALEGRGQVVFEHSQNQVYQFIEEMAAEGYIPVNTFARPFARTWIAATLDSLSNKRHLLNERQVFQLDFFLRDFGKELQVGRDWDRRIDLLFRSDSTFDITVNPILGATVIANENGTYTHRRIGAEFFANIGRVGVYGSLRDNNVSHQLATQVYLNTLDGQNYKSMEAGQRSDYSEATGGISYQWKWGDVSIAKDRFIWGNTVRHANILSGKAPSYAQVYFRMYPVKWLEFHYKHGWLASGVLDSTRTYLTPHGQRRVNTNKNIAANFFTIKSDWNIDFTFGNSVVYSDGGFQLAYWIPFMFFKSVDHTYTGTGSNELGQNAQMYMDISIRSLRKVHLYFSLFIDELSIANMWNPDQHTNMYSLKLGGTWFNALPNLHLSGEYTRTNPWTYRHQIESTTFASNGFNLGHFLGENADEIFGAATYQPWENVRLKGSAWYARKGPEHIYDIINGNANVSGLIFMEHVDWSQLGFRLDAQWEVINEGLVFIAASYQNSKGNPVYTPGFLSGNILSFEAGFRIGL